MRRVGRGEDGFTLVELIVTVAVLGVIVGTLSTAIVVGLRTTDETAQRLSDSHDLQLLSVYLPADVQSAVEGRIDVASTTATGCASTPAASSNLIRFQWEEPGSARQFSAGYRVEANGSRASLVRYSCIDSAAPRRLVVVHGLSGAAQPTPNVTGRSVTVRLTLDSGLTTSVTAGRRTPGSVPPETVIAFPANAGEYNDAAWSGGCPTAGVCGTASDAVGLQSVAVSLLQVSTGKYWDGSAFAAAAATYNSATGLASWTYPFPAASFTAEGAYAVTVRAVNALGTTASATRTFVIDRSAPVTGDDTATLGSGWKKVDQTVTLSPTDSGGAGVAATYFTSDGSAPTTSSTKGTAVGLAAEGTYTVKYFSVDGAGNQEAVKSAGTPIRIDKTAPTAGAVTELPANRHVRNGQVLKATGTDALSGVASIEFLSCRGTTCSPSTSLGSGAGSPASFTWNGQPADGTHRVVARVRDHAGNSHDSGIETVTVDNTAPAVAAERITFSDGDGRIEEADTVAIGFSEKLRASTLCSTWAESPTASVSLSSSGGPVPVSVVVTVTDKVGADELTVAVSGACGDAFNLGKVSLNADYVSATTTFSGSGGNSSVVTWDPTATALTVKLGRISTGGNARSNVAAAVVTYAASPSITDFAGNPLAPASASSAGARRL